MTYEEALKKAIEHKKNTGYWPSMWNFAVSLEIDGNCKTVDPVGNPNIFKKAWGDSSPFRNLMDWLGAQSGITILTIGVYNEDRTKVTWAKPFSEISENRTKFLFKCRMGMDLVRQGHAGPKLLHYALELTKGNETQTTYVDPNTMESTTVG